MPSPLVPVQYRSPAQHDTNYQTALLTYTAPCVCGRQVTWTATAAGSAPNCTCGEDVAA